MPAPELPADLLPLRFRRVGERVVVTSPFGDHAFLTEAELAGLLRGELPPDGETHERLRQARLLKSALDVPAAVREFWTQRAFLDHGPAAHHVCVTLRCDRACAAGAGRCAPADEAASDMSEATAEQVVDLALRTTSPDVTLILGGGEPLLHFERVRHVVDRALDKNRSFGKSLRFELRSNLGSMTDAALDFLVDRKVQITTALGGLADASAFAATQRAVERVHARFQSLGLDAALYHVGVIVEATTAALAEPEALVDALASMGSRTFTLRPVEAWLVAPERRAELVPAPAAFAAFQRRAVGHALALERRGVGMLERLASTFLGRILGGAARSDLEVRSPAASGVGLLAYAPDGAVYTSEEGRLCHAALGDDFFRLGDVAGSRYRQLMTHETVRACVLASLREAQPDCLGCAYAPYCGTRPERHYAEHGTVFGRMRESAECALHKATQDWLFDELARADDATRAALRRWADPPARPHYQHTSVAA